MASVSERIRAVIAELEQIQDVLEQERPREAVVGDLPAVEELKNYLDNLRHFVWAYLEAQNQQEPRDLDSTLQNYRMKRVTEMLRALRAQLDEAATDPDAPSFFQELMLAADTVYDKNLDQYKKRDS